MIQSPGCAIIEPSRVSICNWIAELSRDTIGKPEDWNRAGVLKDFLPQFEGIDDEQAVALYKSGSFDAINALLDSESLTELDERIEMLGKRFFPLRSGCI